MKIANPVIEKVKESSKCKNRLSYEIDVHFTTVDRWVKDNEEDGKLTTATAVKIIAEETNTPIEEVLV